MAWSLNIVDLQQSMIRIHEDDLKLAYTKQSVFKISSWKTTWKQKSKPMR